MKKWGAWGAVGPKMGFSPRRKFLVCGPHQTENQRYFFGLWPAADRKAKHDYLVRALVKHREPAAD